MKILEDTDVVVQMGPGTDEEITNDDIFPGSKMAKVIQFMRDNQIHRLSFGEPPFTYDIILN